MNMYTLIAGEYDSLFPHPRAKTRFVEKLLPPGEGSLLDVGCATGELLLSLDREDRELTGIDLDGEMVASARRKADEREIQGRLEFIQFEMRTYLAHSEKYSRDMILCFGNTLAYLDGPEELDSFMAHTYTLLRPQGQTVLQVLNYDNPTMAGDFLFPDLHTDRVLFTRSYTPGQRDNLLFHTALTDLSTGEKYTDTHALFPFGSKVIRLAASRAGYRACDIYGGYGFDEIGGADFSRLYVLKK